MKNRFNIKKILKHYKEEEDGVVLVVVALAMVIILTCVAYVVDLGVFDYQKSRLQTACDAAALAAMENLPGDMVAAKATALQYIQKNGFSAADVVISFPVDPIYPSFHNVVTVASAQQQKTYFANILGINRMDYNCKATAYYSTTPAGGAFDYLLFSGSRTIPLVMKTNYNILGSVHTNFNFDGGLNNGYVMGAIEAVGNATVKSGVRYGSLTQNAPWVDINTPDFSSVITQVEPAYPWGYNRIYENWEVKPVADFGTFVVPANQNYMIRGDVDFKNGLIVRGKLVVYGNVTVSGKIPAAYGYDNTGIAMPADGLLFAKKRSFDQSLGGTIANNWHFSGSGCLFAERNISFVNGFVYVTTNRTISIYAKGEDTGTGDATQGNIDLNFGGTDGYGMIYAPHGKITVGSGNTTWHGNIIGDELNTIPANVTVAVNDRGLPFIVGAKHAVLIE